MKGIKRNEVGSMEYWTKLYGEPMKKDIEMDGDISDMINNLISIIFGETEFTDTPKVTKIKEKPKKKEKNKETVVFKDIRPLKEKEIATSFAYNKKNEKNFTPLYIPEIKKVMFAPPATIAWFDDGSKSVAVAGHGDKYDKETGLAICMLKRVLGNKEYRYIMDKYCYTNKGRN